MNKLLMMGATLLVVLAPQPLYGARFGPGPFGPGPFGGRPSGTGLGRCCAFYFVSATANNNTLCMTAAAALANASRMRGSFAKADFIRAANITAAGTVNVCQCNANCTMARDNPQLVRACTFRQVTTVGTPPTIIGTNPSIFPLSKQSLTSCAP